ncbi:EthD family reductase [Rhodococcus sp. 06-156-3C]|uniref:EthD domain-containing protein n=1 Tax=Nocardiaceae TaxID=85025 RepID=UPI000522F9D9|nr:MULTISPECIES: EthD domain-containing protein [Rhodococcus]OZD11380.1 EthD family reductase [Rhodococcus sp. 06-156-3C]OZD13616.1 EthD family reductase [Rhodococcus sp. 06-156-4a]OZD22044.1 EthD family reductase [Rhodococcus sp. 06-156-4C]OZD30239.1 EthD family reductase [Rhodococcus sp. 06-156-3]OZD37646.1 EthD family reductase [Rhodococcus sp. 06-156-3b]
MYNLVLVAARPPEWTHDQFITWWRGEHADVTYPLPGLLRWQHTELVEAFGAPSEGWDGLSVLSFESREALEAALASPEWKAAVEHVGTMRGRRMMWYGDEKTMLPLQAAQQEP